MVSSKAIALLAITAGLVTAAPAGAKSPAVKHQGPSARAAGGAPTVLTYPSIVNVRLVRAQAAIDRAIAYADEHQPNLAAASLLSGRSNLRKAWTAAKYVIDTTPPPPPAGVAASSAVFHKSAFSRSGRLRLRKHGYKLGRKVVSRIKAHKAGTAPAAGSVASPQDTAMAVFSLQHLYATTAVGFMDTAHSTFLSGVTTSLFTALNGRDAAIAYIHSIDVVPPPAGIRKGKRVPLKARAAGTAPGGSDWSLVMPAVTLQVDDEIQQVEGTLLTPGLRTGTRRVLNAADIQDLRTERTLNLYWPPAPPAG